MNTSLTGNTILMLIANGFNEIEFTEVQRALLKTGATLKVVSPEKSVANGWHGNGWGHYFPVDMNIGDALGSDFDMMVLVGGERGVNKLAGNPHTKRMVGHFLDAQKPVVAINEAIGLLAMPGKLEGRRIAADPTNPVYAAAGAVVLDEAVTQDGELLTLRGEEMAQLLPALVDHLLAVEIELAAA